MRLPSMHDVELGYNGGGDGSGGGGRRGSRGGFSGGGGRREDEEDEGTGLLGCAGATGVAGGALASGLGGGGATLTSAARLAAGSVGSAAAAGLNGGGGGGGGGSPRSVGADSSVSRGEGSGSGSGAAGGGAGGKAHRGHHHGRRGVGCWMWVGIARDLRHPAAWGLRQVGLACTLAAAAAVYVAVLIATSRAVARWAAPDTAEYVRHLTAATTCAKAATSADALPADHVPAPRRAAICAAAGVTQDTALHYFAMISGGGVAAEHLRGACYLFGSAAAQGVPLHIIGWNKPTVMHYFDKVVHSAAYLAGMQAEQGRACTSLAAGATDGATRAACCTERIVVFADAFDSIFNAPPAELAAALRPLLSPVGEDGGGARSSERPDIVFAAEANYFGFDTGGVPYLTWYGGAAYRLVAPRLGVAWGVPAAAAGWQSPYVYLNSGVYAGKLDAAAAVVSSVLCMSRQPGLHADVYWSDQHSYQLVYQAAALLHAARFPHAGDLGMRAGDLAAAWANVTAADKAAIPRVAITHTALLCGHGSATLPTLGAMEVEPGSGRIRNAITGRAPGIVHLNGNSKQQLPTLMARMASTSGGGGSRAKSTAAVTAAVTFEEVDDRTRLPFPATTFAPLCGWHD